MSQLPDDLFQRGPGGYGLWGVRLFRAGSLVAERAFPAPYALVGKRAENCLRLADAGVSRRHAYLQLFPGGLYCFDLASRRGIRWGDRNGTSGWLRPGERIGLGPFELELLPGDNGGWLAPPHRADGDPLLDRLSDVAPDLPVAVEFFEGGNLRAQGRMNRALTLVGRSARCAFRINNTKLSKFHCSLVCTPLGLWAIDLLSRGGMKLNGQTIRYARLREGDRLDLAQFSLRFRRPDPAAKVAGPVLVGNGRGLETERERPADPAPTAPQGSQAQAPTRRAVVTALQRAAPPVAPSALVARDGTQTLLTLPPNRGGEDLPLLIALVNQFSAMQQQMFDQFQESLLMTTQLFKSMHEERQAYVRQELDELRALGGELRALHEEMARHAARAGGVPSAAPAAPHGQPAGKQAAEAPPAEPSLGPVPQAPPPANPAAGSTPARAGGAPVITPPGAESPEAIHDWLNQRISALQEERQSRWHKLLGIVLGS